MTSGAGTPLWQNHALVTGTPDLTTPHPTLCVARGVTVTIVHTAASTDATVRVTGTGPNGQVVQEVMTGLNGSASPGTVFFGQTPFTTITEVESLSASVVGATIEVGEGAAFFKPTANDCQHWSFERISGTDDAIIRLDGGAATTAGAGDVSNYTDQLVLAGTASRTISAHTLGTTASRAAPYLDPATLAEDTGGYSQKARSILGTGLFSVFPDALEGDCLIRFEALGFGPEGY